MISTRNCNTLIVATEAHDCVLRVAGANSDDRELNQHKVGQLPLSPDETQLNEFLVTICTSSFTD